jgi:hypothetical protein
MKHNFLGDITRRRERERERERERARERERERDSCDLLIRERVHCGFFVTA